MTAGYLPYTADEIDVICNKTEVHPIWHYGVELNGRQKYQSDQLGALRARLGVLENGRSKANVKVKSVHENIGHVWAFDPFENLWFKVLNVRPDYAEGMTLHQHELIRKLWIKQYKGSENYDILLEGKEWLRAFVAKQQISKSVSGRKQAAKLCGLNTNKLIGQCSSSPETLDPFVEIKNGDARKDELKKASSSRRLKSSATSDLLSETEKEYPVVHRVYRARSQSNSEDTKK